MTSHTMHKAHISVSAHYCVNAGKKEAGLIAKLCDAEIIITQLTLGYSTLI